MADPNPVVICCACGREWPAADPGARYRSEDTRWWCRDERSCRQRTEKRMDMRADDKTSIEVHVSTRDRVNALARDLSAIGPGRFGQAETIRWLLDTRDRFLEDTINRAEAELRDGDAR